MEDTGLLPGGIEIPRLRPVLEEFLGEATDSGQRCDALLLRLHEENPEDGEYRAALEAQIAHSYQRQARMQLESIEDFEITGIPREMSEQAIDSAVERFYAQHGWERAHDDSRWKPENENCFGNAGSGNYLKGDVGLNVFTSLGPEIPYFKRSDLSLLVTVKLFEGYQLERAKRKMDGE